MAEDRIDLLYSKRLDNRIEGKIYQFRDDIALNSSHSQRISDRVYQFVQGDERVKSELEKDAGLRVNALKNISSEAVAGNPHGCFLLLSASAYGDITTNLLVDATQSGNKQVVSSVKAHIGLVNAVAACTYINSYRQDLQNQGYKTDYSPVFSPIPLEPEANYSFVTARAILEQGKPLQESLKKEHDLKKPKGDIQNKSLVKAAQTAIAAYTKAAALLQLVISLEQEVAQDREHLKKQPQQPKQPEQPKQAEPSGQGQQATAKVFDFAAASKARVGGKK